MSGSSAVLLASRTLVELLSRRAEAPGRGVAVFSPLGEGREETLSIEALEVRARAIGAALQDRRLQGRAALMLYPSGLDYLAGFFGALYGGVVAVPAYPPEPARLHRTLPRLQAIAKDAGVSAVLCTAAVAEAARAFLHLAPELAALDWIATDAVDDAQALSWRAPALTGQSVAYLQYTSGSTASPKGVVIRHDNLLYTLADIDAALVHDHDSVMVSWLPVYHDMGLIYGLLQPIAQGFKGVLTPPEAFLQRPLRWLELITRHRGTHNAAPNFAFDLCAQRVTPDALAALDLSSWRAAVIAAEPVRPSTMRRFVEAFGGVGFRRETFCPAFGLAEATLKVTIQPVGVAPESLVVDAVALERGEVVIVSPDHPDARRLSGSGRLHLQTRALVTDPTTGLICPPDRVGELRVLGPCVASGYWRREAESAATFGDTPPGEAAPWLRTGDLGFVRDGQLYVVGRIKDMIIVRGQNRYPQDIEWTAQDTHRAVRPGCVAAFAVEEGEEERLVIAAEVDVRRLDGEEALAALSAAIRERVTDAHGLAVSGLALLPPQALPKTSSGKVQRHAAREAWRAGAMKALHLWRAPQAPVAAAAAPELDAAAVEAWLRARLSPSAPEALDLDAPFTSLGLDSVASVGLSEELASRLGRPLPPSLLWQHPSARRLLAHLTGHAPGHAPSRPAAPAAQEPIAVIGLALRFPGAESPEALRELLYEGRDAVGVVPPGRWDGAPGAELAPKAGGFLSEVAGFDARFFGVAPREALAMDPQQRLLLEVSWEALERANLPAAGLAGRSVGVYIGVSASDWETRHLRSGQPARLDPWSATGSALSAAAGRLAYTLDLRGPAMAIDTACSSSLVGVHLACRALRAGECELALAGGVNLMLSPELSLCFSRMGALSPTGRCRAFDDAADGYVRGEGVGVVVLKPLSAARRDGDRVLGLILGSAVNQDGRSHGFTAPNGEAQEAVIRAALADAGVSPAEVLAVEAHGTGTPLGDPIEVEALAAVLGQGRAAPLRLGSVKANLGHLEAAAGVAGLIKALITLGEPTLPPQLHLRTPSHRIPWATLGVEARAEASPWPEGRRVIGVSGFGITGTNAHVVLAAAPADGAGDTRPPAPPPYVWPLSAASSESLRALARRSVDVLHAAAPEALADLCATAARHRSPQRWRRALVGRDAAALAAELEALAAGALPEEDARRSPGRLVFVYSGQGAQRPGMALALARSCPAFGEALERVSAALCAESGGPSLLDELALGPAPARLADPRFAQAATFALQVGLTEALAAWGLRPALVMGHSVGELAAAWAAGALTLQECACVLRARGEALAAVAGTGDLALLRAPAPLARRLLAAVGDAVAVAASQSPEELLIAGAPGALAALAAAAAAQGASARTLGLGVPFHSPALEPYAAAVAGALKGLRPKATALPLISTLTGAAVDGASMDGAFWARQLWRPVRFREAVAAAGAGCFLELGPRSTLRRAIQESLGDAAERSVTLSALERGQDEPLELLRAAAALWERGVLASWSEVVAPPRARRDLPTTVWERQPFWIEPARGAAGPSAPGVTARGAGLMGPGKRVAVDPSLRLWELSVAPGAASWYAVAEQGGAPRLPAWWCVELLRAGAAELLGGPPRLVSLRLQPLYALSNEGGALLQLAARPRAEGGYALHLAARAADEDAPWTLLAEGHAEADAEAAPPPVELLGLRDRASHPLAAASFYRALAGRGVVVSASARRVTRVWRGEREVFATLAPQGEVETGCALHPAAAEAGLSLLHLLFERAWPQAALSLAAASAVRVLRPGADPSSVVATLGEGGDEATVLWLAESGEVVAVVEGARARASQSAAQAVPVEAAVPRWLPLSLPPGRPGRWVLVGEGAEPLAEALRALGDAVERVVERVELAETLARIPRPKALVCLCPPGVSLEDAPESLWAPVLDLARASLARPNPPRVVVITRGATARPGAAPDPAQAAIWGLVKALRAEAPATRAALIDAPTVSPPWSLVARAARAEQPEHELAVDDDGARALRYVGAGAPVAAPGPVGGRWLLLGALTGPLAGLARALAARSPEALLLAPPVGEPPAGLLEDLRVARAPTQTLSGLAVKGTLDDAGRLAGLIVSPCARRAVEALSLNAAALRAELLPTISDLRRLTERDEPFRLLILGSGEALRGLSGGAISAAVEQAAEALIVARRAAGRPGAALSCALPTLQAEHEPSLSAALSASASSSLWLPERLRASFSRQALSLPALHELAREQERALGERTLSALTALLSGFRRVNDVEQPPDLPLSASGLDSMAAVEFLREVEARFTVTFSLSRLDFGQVTLRGLVAEVLQARLDAPSPDEPTRELPAPPPQPAARPPEERPSPWAFAPGGRLVLSRVDGLPLELYVAGEGPPVVLLPPIWSTAPIWRAQIERLSAHHAVIVPHYPGYGRSAFDPAVATPAQVAERLVRALDDLGHGGAFALIGWSLGGMVAQRLAARHPERVRALVLVNTTARLDEDDSATRGVELLSGLVADFERGLLPFGPATQRAMRAQLEQGGQAGPSSLLMHYASETLRFDARAELGLIRAPTLIVQGAKDSLTPPSLGRLLHERIPGARYVELREGGHYVPLQHPERFNQLVEEHLRAQAPSVERAVSGG